MTNRRTFLKSSLLAAAGASLLARSKAVFAVIPAGDVLGIQLYSIRDAMSKKPMESLKKIASIGYRYVEHANYVNQKFYGYSAVEFKKILDDLGLKMPSGHTVMGRNHWDESRKDFTDEWKKTVEDAATVGQKWVISPSLEEGMRKTMDELKKSMELFNKSGELCHKHGMKFGYHNHDFEFSEKLDDKRLFDLILEMTDPRLVTQQLDIGNMYHAGGRALEILEQYPGRFELLHVKDEIKRSDGNYESTILGKGVVNSREISELARKSGGTYYYIVEQEAYQGMDPMECVKEDYKVMRDWGY